VIVSESRLAIGPYPVTRSGRPATTAYTRARAPAFVVFEAR